MPTCRVFLTFIFVLLLFHCYAFDHHDKVTSLPGAPKSVQFDLFAGYLNGSSNSADVPIFYVLAESIRVESSTAPLIIWFNGGPGGSSLYGFFTENGPYRVTEAGDSLTYNEFSWNQYANVLYLESPLGVGFSQNNSGEVTTNDLETAEINFSALRDFITRVHSRYENREYYLSGESYAGIYVPYLARRLLQEIDSGKMKGDNFKMRILQQEVVLNSWLKHLRGEKLSDNEINDVDDFIDYVYVNFIGDSPIYYNLVEHCYKQNFLKRLLLQNIEYHMPNEKASMACYGEHSLEVYLNSVEVQVALHIRHDRRSNWETLNRQLNQKYMRDLDVLPVYNDIFRLLNGSSFHILLYSGDTDPAIPTLHTIRSASKVAAANQLVDQRYDRAWKFYGDFAGMLTGYKRGNMTMDLITVRGSGHFVPTDLPAQAFQIINNFINEDKYGIVHYSEPIRKHCTKQLNGISVFVLIMIILIICAAICAIFYGCRLLLRRRQLADVPTVNYIKIQEESQLDVLPV